MARYSRFRSTKASSSEASATVTGRSEAGGPANPYTAASAQYFSLAVAVFAVEVRT